MILKQHAQIHVAAGDSGNRFGHGGYQRVSRKICWAIFNGPGQWHPDVKLCEVDKTGIYLYEYIVLDGMYREWLARAKSVKRMGTIAMVTAPPWTSTGATRTLDTLVGNDEKDWAIGL